jgi:hypothetical protein
MEFSMTRFWLLVRKQWAEQWRLYLTYLLVGLGFLFLLGLGFSSGDWSRQQQSVFFMLTLWIAGGLFAADQFSELGTKAHGTAALTLPASHFEKFLVGVFYSVVVFLPVFILVFYLIDVPLVELARRNPGPYADVAEIRVLNVLTYPFKVSVFAFFLLIQIIALLASIFAGQYAFVKGALVLFGIIYGGFFGNGLIAKALIPAHDVSGFPFANIQFRLTESASFTWVHTPEPFQTLLLYVGGILLPLVLLGIAYLRLTEKEI